MSTYRVRVTHTCENPSTQCACDGIWKLVGFQTSGINFRTLFAWAGLDELEAEAEIIRRNQGAIPQVEPCPHPACLPQAESSIDQQACGTPFVRLQKKLDSNFYYMHTEKLLQATNLRLIATRILELHQEGLKIFACCTREDQHEYNYINARQTSARRPVARALPQLRLVPGQPVSPLDFSSVGRTGSQRAPGHCVSRRDYSSSELHWL
jgi:hypothetical protein